MVFLEDLFVAGAKTHRQHGLTQEVVRIFGTDPAHAMGGKAAAGNDAVDVGMKAEIARPGLEHSKQAQFCAEVFVIAADIQQRSCDRRKYSLPLRDS